MRYAAARVGAGSEVLGFDTARSADHEWGPRLELFLAADDITNHATEINALLAERLPKTIRGWPTHFDESGDPFDPSGIMRRTDGPVNHRIGIRAVDSWLEAELGLQDTSGEPTVREWLAMPQQKLAELTGGVVFRDDLGALSHARRVLAWYPDQIWRYLLACQWQRISQEEAFVGRCAEVGDDLGSVIITARLVRDVMRLCFLLERQYAPYSKWLGSAFGRLGVAGELQPVLRAALTATDYEARERHLCTAYETVATRQNATGLVARSVDPAPRQFHSRPFFVIGADRFARALAGTITDPELSALPLTGGVDQWADNTEFLGLGRPRRSAVDAF
ncbi:DUF4037 domain-containing protein [Phytoactinopolyspora sp. XMNu-373]|uniref:DUF4037 domain-containing protein n=2 Tax=Phytoactinopolyspora mesophila TaxID=2650750 RepID=A0A7K3LZC6_9ACTN|nr:DUF4037 domain-containing protein [Phytoactinopolyspora mesophila]